MKRLYKLTDSGFVTAETYYTTVLNNPKANSRIKKKAKDILDEVSNLNGWPQLRKAAVGEMTLQEYLHHRRLTRGWAKRNIGCKRHHSNVPYLTAFKRYIEYAKSCFE